MIIIKQIKQNLKLPDYRGVTKYNFKIFKYLVLLQNKYV